MTPTDLKRIAGEAAAERVTSGQVLGLGTGSTVRFFLEALARRVRAGKVEGIVGVPTSNDTEDKARALDLPVASLDEHPELDLCVDGADEVDPELNLIKGLGGALLREKIVAAASARFLVIVDESKRVTRLGEKAPVPVEVLPFGWKPTARAIGRLGGRAELRIKRGTPVVTDQGNLILDCAFGPLDDPRALARELDALPGALGHGLFLGMAHEVVVGTGDGAHVLSR
jgi:ribose 5-phosphate isomerase A